MCMCVCVCVCVCVRPRVYFFACACACVCGFVYVWAFVCYELPPVQFIIRIYTCLFFLFACLISYHCTYACIHTYASADYHMNINGRIPSVCVYTHLRMRLCMYTYVRNRSCKRNQLTSLFPHLLFLVPKDTNMHV